MKLLLSSLPTVSRHQNMFFSCILTTRHFFFRFLGYFVAGWLAGKDIAFGLTRALSIHKLSQMRSCFWNGTLSLGSHLNAKKAVSRTGPETLSCETNTLHEMVSKRALESPKLVCNMGGGHHPLFILVQRCLLLFPSLILKYPFL